MRQRRAAWLVALPVAIASWLNAHCLAYVLVPPAPSEHMHHHAESGHAYIGSAPVLIAVLITVLAAGLVLCAGEGLRGRTGGLGPPALLFALLPSLGFVSQELIEGLVRSESLSAGLFMEPTFLAGFALQLPFAAGALMFCRCLYAIGYGLGCLLAACPGVTASAAGSTPATHRRPMSVALIAPSVLAQGHGSRAPPALACP
jgi:hypothetical protein